jgi:hypothetical protein
VGFAALDVNPSPYSHNLFVTVPSEVSLNSISSGSLELTFQVNAARASHGGGGCTGGPSTIPLRIGKALEAPMLTRVPTTLLMIGVIGRNSQPMLTTARSPRSVPVGKAGGGTSDGWSMPSQLAATAAS